MAPPASGCGSCTKSALRASPQPRRSARRAWRSSRPSVGRDVPRIPISGEASWLPGIGADAGKMRRRSWWMRIATWNVNGLRARIEYLVPWLRERRPDLVGLQELKLTEEQFPHALFETEDRK